MLVRRLLGEIGLRPKTLRADANESLADLETVLRADYRQVPALPRKELAQELDQIVEDKIKPYPRMWHSWANSRTFCHLSTEDCGEIVVRARPYLHGSGLGLWGFSCNAVLGNRHAFVIYLNTAHDRGAIAATISHELGHYIHGSIAPELRPAWAAMAPTFASHLARESELFSDSVVALSAYSRPLIREILGTGASRRRGTDVTFERIRMALRTLDQRYRIDLTRQGLPGVWRVRYLTSMVHFFKLRSALLEAAGI